MPANIPVVITDRELVQSKVKSASTTLYDVARTAYGPGAGNVIIGFRHGPPLLSRDGVTNIKMVRSEDIHEDDIIKSILAASEKNNHKVGDGTTAVTILTHNLILESQRLEGKGMHPMEIANKLHQAEQIALAYIESITVPIKKTHLARVATISANDENLGQLVADVMEKVGKDGGVIVDQYQGLGVHSEIVDGFYFAKGYKDTELINDMQMNQSTHTDVPILISSKILSTELDIKPLLESLSANKIKEVVMVGEVRGEALEILKYAKKSGQLHIVPVDPILSSGATTLFLDDCAVMTGAKVYNGAEFDPETYLGFAKEAIVSEGATSILGGDSDTKEVKARIKSLREQLKESDSPASVYFIKERLARLTGKMGIIKVGGALELEREEKKLRVQDAVCAVQSAMKEGIVPGGGTTLARVKGTDFDDAFKEPFKLLIANMGLNPEAYLARLEESEVWYGYNLKAITTQPIHLLEAGVIDASLVIKEVVRNAVSVAAGLITGGVLISFKEKD